MIKEFFNWILYKLLVWSCPDEMKAPELDEHENALGE